MKTTPQYRFRVVTEVRNAGGDTYEMLFEEFQPTALAATNRVVMLRREHEGQEGFVRIRNEIVRHQPTAVARAA